MDNTGGYAQPIDWVIIAAYMVLIFGMGSWLARFNRSARDFFIGGQRFGWGIIALSLVATIVGSYSFVKYAAAAYKHGFAATMSYLNDWFWMPLFMFLWLPILYYNRVASVPEYFERRFDRRARAMATLILLLYMVGYIGINLLTMGKVAAQLLGYEQTLTPVFASACVVAVVCAAYVTSGGQAAVILSDVFQGILLLLAGLWLFVAGVDALGGFSALWNGLAPIQRLPLAPFNKPHNFNFVGVFWQDAVTNGMVVYFLNQGLMLRFLSGRSVDTGRRAVVLVLILLQPLAALAVANAGWIGRAMVNTGLIADTFRPDEIFMVVARLLSGPGVFGFVLAALTAALMSTADTLINASASIWVNDVWRVYVRPDADERELLKIGRIASIAAAAIGIAMVPVYFQIGTIYQAHGAFTAAVGPPMAVTLMLGLLWRRFTPAAAFWTMSLGLIAIAVSFPIPQLVSPFAMGVDMSDNLWKAYSFQRALYGLVVSGAIGVTVTMLTTARSPDSIAGLVVGTIDAAKTRFKGSEIHHEDPGPKQKLSLTIAPATLPDSVDPQIDPGNMTHRWQIFAEAETLATLQAEPGDLVNLRDPRPLLADLRGITAVIKRRPSSEKPLGAGIVALSERALSQSQLNPKRLVTAQRVL